MSLFSKANFVAVMALLFSGAQSKIDYNRGMNPGMALRLEQKTIEAFKTSMQDFFPHYVVADMMLPTSEKYTFNWLFEYVTWTVEWKDISYDVPKFDIQDIQFTLTDRFDAPEIIVDFPALQSWKIHALQSTDSIWLPDDSRIELEFKDFDVDFSASLAVNEKGNLKPTFYTLHIKFGDSYMTHDNWFFAFCMHQFVEFSLIIIENTAFFCGELMFSQIGEPILTTFLNEYRLPLDQMPSPFLGQGVDRYANFELDWRNTVSPVIKEGQMDMYFLGEITRPGESCGELEPDQFDFMGTEIMSQAVMSESALTCALNSMAGSPIGQVNLNEERLNTFFGVNDLKFDTSNFARHIPLFKQKLGVNKPLKVALSMKNIEVKLGQFDCDVQATYTLTMGWFLDLLGSKELMYDEVRFITKANLQTKNDVAFIQVLKNEILIDNKFGGKQKPVRNTMKMSNNEYREFLSQLGSSAEKMKTWLNNDIFKNGAQFPYHPDEFITNIQFQDKSVHLMFELEENMTGLMERKLW